MNPSSAVSVKNPFKSGEKLRRKWDTRSEKPANMTFEIKVMDLKISHMEFCKKYFRQAFQGRDLDEEAGRVEILESILGYE